jgi:signal transduction histidine kinase/CheY-like chemotaxis protein/HPt (histidine-containing phosphotransfer) domain-containing protein
VPSAPAVAAPAERELGNWPWLLIGGLVLMMVTLIAAAFLYTRDLPWILGAGLLGAALGAVGLRGALSARGTGAAAPTQTAPSRVQFDEPGPTVVNELKRELERYKEAERQLTRAKQEAEAATMAKGEFLATMSHEIRTPLNGIIPLLDILLSTQLAPDQRDYLNTAYQSSKQLLGIVDDILDYSKIEANKLELEQVGINIKEIVDSVTRLMAKNAEAKNLRFTATIDANVRLAMRGDPVRLRQVLTNLVSNAIKFTERGQIAIDVKKRNDTRTNSELLFSVRDTGIGIAQDAQARLFQPFSQADASTTRIHGGTGLGLVICKRIVDLMGGQIGVKSEPGKGSMFWFCVPLLKAVGDVAPLRSDVNGSRALIVTTEQGLLRRISGYFSTWGVNFVQTSVAAEALGKLRSAALMGDSWAYDFVILDWGAMRASALSLAKNILRDQALERLRLVAISGEEEVPGEVRGTPRMLVLARQFSDVEMRSGMQRLLQTADQDAATGAPVESLLSELPPAATEPAATTAPASATPASSAAPAAPAPLTAQHHVLLVEDNPVNRQVAQRLLTLVGVSFDLAEHGKQALERLEQGKYDAVLMDCQMPIMDGYVTTRTIRKLEAEGTRAGHVPVIAMTANAMAGDREKCLAAGMDDYMSKPLNRALLEQTLRKWLPASSANAAAPAGATQSASVRAPARAPTPAAAATTPVSSAIAARAPAAYAAPQRSGSAIDQAVIQDLLEMMGAEFTDLVRVYLEDTPKSIAALERAAERNDMEGLIAPSHSLKSTSANLGALNLAELTKRIEHGARQRNLVGEPVMLVAEVSNEYRRVTTELRKLLGAN